jgi:hypothetical protein
MDNQAPRSQSLPEPVRPADRQVSRMAGRRGVPAPGQSAAHPASEDWQPANGLVNRMLAYSDWWNIPSARPRSASRA